MHSHRQRQHRKAARRRKDSIHDSFSTVRCSVAMAMELDPAVLSWRCFDVFEHRPECRSAVHKTRRVKTLQASDGLDSLLPTNADLLARTEHRQSLDWASKLTKLEG